MTTRVISTGGLTAYTYSSEGANKQIFSTLADRVQYFPAWMDKFLQQFFCNQEVDSRLILHLLDVAPKDSNSIFIQLLKHLISII